MASTVEAAGGHDVPSPSAAIDDYLNRVDGDKNDDDGSDPDNVLNISLESDRLDPSAKAAHEAPTLPMGNTDKEKKDQDDTPAWKRKVSPSYG